MKTDIYTLLKETAPVWIAYYRVSTKKQGLGLEAQRAKVMQAAQEVGATILEEVEEKESGKECDRPGLNKAMALAKKNGATLVVAKHDRLSRDLSFAAHLVFKSGVRFNILNLPSEALKDALLFGVYYGMAEKEARLISERTKAALAVRKAQGVKLGNPRGAESITPEMVEAATEARKRKAEENPNNISSANEIRRFIASGKKSLREVARHLTESGYYTSTGRFHTAKSVQLLCQRYAIAL